ncbi:MAG TPA: hypothetical protein VGP72_05425 [Planctomycetota bacterium]|jgi:hypothetical protein
MIIATAKTPESNGQSGKRRVWRVAGSNITTIDQADLDNRKAGRQDSSCY